MFTAKQIWRKQHAEKIVVFKEPQPDWDTKTRIAHHFGTMPEGYMLTSQNIAQSIYQNDSEHTVEMIEDALRELLLHGILATKTELPRVFYRLHPDMHVVLERIRSTTNTQ